MIRCLDIAIVVLLIGSIALVAIAIALLLSALTGSPYVAGHPPACQP